MGTAFVTIAVSDQELSEALLVAVEDAQDFRPYWRRAHPAYLYMAHRMFDSGGFGQWPSYDETQEQQYAAAKGEILGRRMGRDDVLRWKGGRERLHPAFVDPMHPEHVADMSETMFEVGVSVPYAYHHDKGVGVGPDWGGSKPIPRRSLTDTDEQFVDDLADRLSLWASEIGSKIGLTKGEVVGARLSAAPLL